MDDFDAPSFSLGLDEEIHESPASQAVLSSNPFRIRTSALNGTHDTDYDSDFELPPPSSTERIMKRLKQTSGQSFSVPSTTQQPVQHTNSIGKAKGMGSQNLGRGMNEKKTRTTPSRKNAERSVQTLQNIWQGLNGKLTLNVSADSGCNKNYTGSKAGCTGQGFGGLTLEMPMDPSARMSGSQTGASQQVCEGSTSYFSLGQHSLASKAGVCQGYAESSCGGKEGSLSQGHAEGPNDKKEDLLEKWGTCRGNTLQSFESCIDVKSHEEELPIKNAEQSRDTTFESSGNGMHDQRTGFHLAAATNGKGLSQTFQKNLDENSNFLDDFSFANTSEKTAAPMQSSWRGLDMKTRNLSDDFSARCESLISGKSSEGPKMTPKDQQMESDLDQIKTNTIDTSQNNTNALHSFWKSLTETKPHEINIGAEVDDIENCSSDDDFELGTQSTRKLSLCGNTTTRKTCALGNSVANHTFGRSSCNPHLIETSVNVRANNNSAFQYPPNKNMADARAPSSLALRSPVNTFPASPRTYQSFVAGDASRDLPVHNLDKFQTKQSSFIEKLPNASPKNISWPCLDDDNDDEFFPSHALNEERAWNDCATPTPAYNSNASPLGCNNSPSLNPISSNDPRIANLLRVRFPHFTSITALRQGDFIGSEQVYIDYGNQFSGGKAASCQSGSRVFKRQAKQTAPRSSTKWRQASQKKQNCALADNGGWIQTGNRNPSRNCALKNKKGCKESQGGSQTPVNIGVDSSIGAGHWVTERTGKRIYITKDGRKLSGSSAYKQHIKDSGKRFKKTKRRRPRNT